jgi:hypothetical protein
MTARCKFCGMEMLDPTGHEAHANGEPGASEAAATAAVQARIPVWRPETRSVVQVDAEPVGKPKRRAKR